MSDESPVVYSNDSKALSPWKRFRHRLEVPLIKAATCWIPLLPWSAMRAMVRILGTLGYWLLAEDRRVAHANLGIVFGEQLTSSQRRRLARHGFITFATAAVGLFWFPRLRRDTIGRYIEFDPAGLEMFRRLQQRGNGIVLFMCHHGHWELFCQAMGYAGLPMMMITETQPNATLGRMIQRLRGLSGNQTIEPRYAVLKLFRHLKKGGIAAFMLDYNARRNRGIWLDFFGLKVYNSNAAAELAARTGATIVAAVAMPLPDGRIHVTFHTPVGTEPLENADLQAINQRCLDFAQETIRRHPEHWLWTYKRWKRRPIPERGPYPFYSKFAGAPSQPANEADSSKD